MMLQQTASCAMGVPQGRKPDVNQLFQTLLRAASWQDHWLRCCGGKWQSLARWPKRTKKVCSLANEDWFLQEETRWSKQPLCWKVQHIQRLGNVFKRSVSFQKWNKRWKPAGGCSPLEGLAPLPVRETGMRHFLGKAKTHIPWQNFTLVYFDSVYVLPDVNTNGPEASTWQQSKSAEQVSWCVVHHSRGF